jgi:alkanesulfonate monooxygenase SsuD/methylene tetrahydromethanopterin reductase-like flavin-dependent oxidoreductase (luciferase family)
MTVRCADFGAAPILPRGHMSERSYRERIGISLSRRPSNDLILRVEQYEHAGIATIWSTQNPFDTDVLTLYAAVAARTTRIQLGTSIVPAFTRHPLALVSQVRTIEQISPHRLRLGLGTSHQRMLEGGYGVSPDRAISRLREYLLIVRQALRTGAVAIDGEFYRAHAQLRSSFQTPVLVSALREHAWELAGAASDGGISWNVPQRFLLERALPAMERGAAACERDRPPMIGHVVLMFANGGRSRGELRETARRHLAGYAQTVYYPRMWEASGYPLGPDRQVPEALIDALIFISDDDAEIAEHLRGHLDRGIDEVLVQLIPGVDRDLDEARLAAIVGNI